MNEPVPQAAETSHPPQDRIAHLGSGLPPGPAFSGYLTGVGLGARSRLIVLAAEGRAEVAHG